jgi:hypothetical protein
MEAAKAQNWPVEPQGGKKKNEKNMMLQPKRFYPSYSTGYLIIDITPVPVILSLLP